MTKTEAMWSERVRGWRASGRTATEFAVGAGFEASTLRYWASRLKRAEDAPRPHARLLRVTPTSAGVSAPLVVVAGGARIEVRAGFDATLLRDVVRAPGDAA